MKKYKQQKTKFLISLCLLCISLSASAQLLPGNLYGQMVVGSGTPWVLINGDLKIMSTGELFLGSHSPRGEQTNQLAISGNYIGEDGSRIYISVNDNSNTPGTRGYIDIIGTATKTDGPTTIELDAFNKSLGWNGACIDLIRANAVGSDPGTFRMNEQNLNGRIGLLRYRYYNNDLVWFFAEKLILGQRIDAQTICRDASFNPLSVTVAPGEYTYQWYRCNESGNSNSFVNLGSANGAQTAHFTPPANAIGTNYYRCIVTSLTCNYNTDTTTVSGAIIVNANVRIIRQPESQAIIDNGIPVNIQLSVETEGATSYQWFRNGIAISNSNSPEITVELGDAMDTYHVEVSGCGGTIVSETATAGGNCLDLIVQKRNHTLTINNNPNTNGGHQFVYFRWFKNGELIKQGDAPTDYADHYYTGGNSLDLEALYHVELTTADGVRFVSCEYQFKWATPTPSIKVYPNPVTNVSNKKITLEVLDLEDESALNNASIVVYSPNGQILSRSKATGRETQLQMPNITGVYIVRFIDDTISTDVKVIVK